MYRRKRREGFRRELDPRTMSIHGIPPTTRGLAEYLIRGYALV